MKRAIIIFFLGAVFCCNRVSAQQTEIEKQIQKKEPSFTEEEKKAVIYTHSLYEYSWIKEGSRKGNWRVFSNRVAYLKDNLQFVYLDSTAYDRLGVRDYSLDFGSYIKLRDGYIHGEAGFDPGPVHYIYKFKGLLEVEQRLVNNLFYNIDGRYLHHTEDNSGDVYVFSPALVYYFGNNYVSSGYGVSFTQHRDCAQFGTVQGNFALNERVHLWLGAALGERLFDIDILKSNKQFGSIFFGGTDINITRNITFRIGGSYSKERPSFIKRGVDFGLKMKF
jgi:YaiO family outer membrane protein